MKVIFKAIFSEENIVFLSELFYRKKETFCWTNEKREASFFVYFMRRVESRIVGDVQRRTIADRVDSKSRDVENEVDTEKYLRVKEKKNLLFSYRMFVETNRTNERRSERINRSVRWSSANLFVHRLNWGKQNESVAKENQRFRQVFRSKNKSRKESSEFYFRSKAKLNKWENWRKSWKNISKQRKNYNHEHFSSIVAFFSQSNQRKTKIFFLETAIVKKIRFRITLEKKNKFISKLVKSFLFTTKIKKIVK